MKKKDNQPRNYEEFFQAAVRTSFLITESISRGDIQEASDLRLLLNHYIDTLLSIKRLNDDIYEKY